MLCLAIWAMCIRIKESNFRRIKPQTKHVKIIPYVGRLSSRANKKRPHAQHYQKTNQNGVSNVLEIREKLGTMRKGGSNHSPRKPKVFVSQIF